MSKLDPCLRAIVATTVLISALLCLPSFAADATGDEALRIELEQMLESDQRHRASIRAASDEHGDESPQVQAMWQAQSAIDAENIARLVQIVEAGGWPGKRRVGPQAATAAFLVLQHADLEPQQRFLPLLRQAVADGEAERSSLALLEDRVRVRNGLPQLFGSQLSWDAESGALRFDPIEDEINVDRRRAEMGLEPIGDYARRFGLEYSAPGGS
jgi:hypothetical protein